MKKMIRECPKCSEEIEYKSSISYKKALKDNKPCQSCTAKERSNRPQSRAILLNNLNHGSGVDNNMYGKTVYDVWVVKYGEEVAEKKFLDFKLKMRKINNESKNMSGKTVFDIWVEKYGEEVADEKMNELREKHSKNNSGEGNPMYGKPSPQGSGNGWSGWYNGWFFRSLRELTYMIKVIERFNLKWESGESNKYKIPYIDYKGNKRNYFPDFVIESKYIIECKPRRLWDTPSVLSKKEGALKFCGDNGLVYKTRDVGTLNEEEIKELYNNKEIKFTERYERKYKENYCS